MPGDGTVHAWMTLQLQIPDTPSIEYTRVDVRPTGAIEWELGRGIVNGRGTQQVRISGLVPGIAYDFRAVNISGPNESAPATLNNQLASGDTIAPSAPTAIAVRQSGAKVAEVDVTYRPPKDAAFVEVYRNTTNSSTTATRIDTKGAATGDGVASVTTRFHDENVSYGTTYFYWAKIVDRTGNKSGFSPSSGHSITIGRLASGDYSDQSVIPVKRAPVASVSYGPYSVNSVFPTRLSDSVSHGLGVSPLVTASSGNAGAAVTLLNVTPTTISFVITYIGIDPVVNAFARFDLY